MWPKGVCAVPGRDLLSCTVRDGSHRLAASVERWRLGLFELMYDIIVSMGRLLARVSFRVLSEGCRTVTACRRWSAAG